MSSFHSTIIDPQNNVWVIGNNMYKQMGLRNHGVDDYTRVPAVKAKKVIGKNTITFLIGLDNQVWAAGEGREIGHYEYFDEFTPILDIQVRDIDIYNNRIIAIDLDNNLWLIEGGVRFESTLLMTNVMSISAYSNRLLIVDLEGRLYLMGDYRGTGISEIQGEVSNKPFEIPGVKVRKALMARSHSVALTIDGKVLVAGYNGYGELGFDPDEVTSTANFIVNPNIEAIDIYIGDNRTYVIG